MKPEWFRTFSILLLNLPIDVTRALEICMTQLLWFPSTDQFSQILDEHGLEHWIDGPSQASICVISKSGVLVQLERRISFDSSSVFVYLFVGLPISSEILYFETTNEVCLTALPSRRSKPIDRLTFALAILDLLEETVALNQANWISRFAISLN